MSPLVQGSVWAMELLQSNMKKIKMGAKNSYCRNCQVSKIKASDCVCEILILGPEKMLHCSV